METREKEEPSIYLAFPMQIVPLGDQVAEERMFLFPEVFQLISEEAIISF